MKTLLYFFVSAGVVLSVLCEKIEVFELVENMEQLVDKPQCPCNPLRANQCNGNWLLMVQNSLALQTLRCSLQPYVPKNKKGEFCCIYFMLWLSFMPPKNAWGQGH